MRWTTVLVVLVGLNGCGTYDPPAMGDHAAEAYQTDLAVCRKDSAHAVYLKNAGDIGTWMISPITEPGMVRAAIRTCMAGKGYRLEAG